MNYLYISLIIVLLILIFSQIYASMRAAPWAPTRKDDVDEFLKLAGIKKGEKVYDLGCGDGRLLAAAVGKGAQATGFEISLFPYLLAKWRLSRLGNKNAQVLYKDFWNVDLHSADVVYFFLMPRIYEKLRKKLEKELKKGTRVITYVWPMEQWKPQKVRMEKGKTKIYLYKI